MPDTSNVAITYVQAPAGPDGLRTSLRQLLIGVADGTLTNPLRDRVAPGCTVVIKPNMVRHHNPAGPLTAVVTSPEVVRALVEAAFDAVGEDGRVVVADSPQNDCDFDALLSEPAWQDVLGWAAGAYSHAFEVLDMRPEAVTMRDGIVVSRRRLPGDPLGETTFDLADASAFVRSGIDAKRLRGSEYDPALTRSSHSDGRHSYSVCRTFLRADLLIVVPKVKTHKKVGLSLAMKNLVGMVGEKNCLPHHTAGFPSNGGDEYPDRRLWPVLRQWAAERARPVLASGRGIRAARMLRRLERAALPEVVSRSGNWWGNDTAWRMVVDLVTILRRERYDRGLPTLFVYDGLVVGEGNGPLAPSALPFGLLAVSDNPVAGDVAVANELGVDEQDIPLLREAVARCLWPEPATLIRVSGEEPSCTRRIRLHPGWAKQPHLGAGR